MRSWARGVRLADAHQFKLRQSAERGYLAHGVGVANAVDGCADGLAIPGSRSGRGSVTTMKVWIGTSPSRGCGASTGKGTLVVHADGTFTYTPTAEARANAGEPGYCSSCPAGLNSRTRAT